MMSSPMLYPVFLKLAGLQCLVVGGGCIAERKIEMLIETGAVVTVVSPQCTETVQQLISQHNITWIKDVYKSTYIEGMNLVISATNSSFVNETVYKDAVQRRIFINSVDDPERCSFIVPASCRKGDIQMAVCTSGAAPGLSSKIRDLLAEHISSKTVAMVGTVKSLRSSIKGLPKDLKKDFWDLVFSLDMEACENDEQIKKKVHEIFHSVHCRIKELDW